MTTTFFGGFFWVGSRWFRFWDLGRFFGNFLKRISFGFSPQGWQQGHDHDSLLVLFGIGMGFLFGLGFFLDLGWVMVTLRFYD